MANKDFVSLVNLQENEQTTPPKIVTLTNLYTFKTEYDKTTENFIAKNKVGTGLDIDENGVLFADGTEVEAVRVIANSALEKANEALENTGVYGEATIIDFICEATKWSEDKTYIIENNKIFDKNIIRLTLQNNIDEPVFDAVAAAKLVAASQKKGSIVIKALGEKPAVDIPMTMIIEGGVNIVGGNLVDLETGQEYELALANKTLYLKEIANE